MVSLLIFLVVVVAKTSVYKYSPVLNAFLNKKKHSLPLLLDLFPRFFFKVDPTPFGLKSQRRITSNQARDHFL